MQLHEMQLQRTIEVMKRSRSLALIPALLIVALFADLPNSSVAASEKTPVAAVNTSGGTAVKGYDPVAYFTLGQPTPGVDQYTYRWKGVTYRFASAENLARFRADPEKYLPQYGGYCAYAMSINRIADISPTEWTIFGGKLYLNNNFISQTLWSLDKSGRVETGDRNWAVFPKSAEGK
jgi:YHS domain-containing protein